jgi:hypothetical protein
MSFLSRVWLLHPWRKNSWYVWHICTNDEQQDATIWLIYLFLMSSTCFGRCLHPSSGALDCIYSFCYCPPILLLAGIKDEMDEFHLIPDTSWQQYWWTLSEAVNTKFSWWWAKTLPETCSARNKKISQNSCILLVVIYNHTSDTRIHEREVVIFVTTGTMLSAEIVVTCFLYGCESWSVTLRKKHKPRVFENRCSGRYLGLSGGRLEKTA